MILANMFIKPTTQSRGKEVLVGLLILGNFLQVGIEGILESSLHEVGLGVVLETLLVESSLEVLESQGIVQNVGWVKRLAWPKNPF